MVALKRNIITTGLVLLIAWPVVHFALHQRYAIDAWKLCGWAMYARPAPLRWINVSTIDRTDEATTFHFDSAALDAALLHAGRMRGVFGEIYEMRPLAEAVLDATADAVKARIDVTRAEFDCRTARFDDVVGLRYEYDRDGALHFEERQLDAE